MLCWEKVIGLGGTGSKLVLPNIVMLGRGSRVLCALFCRLLQSFGVFAYLVDSYCMRLIVANT